MSFTQIEHFKQEECVSTHSWISAIYKVLCKRLAFEKCSFTCNINLAILTEQKCAIKHLFYSVRRPVKEVTSVKVLILGKVDLSLLV